MSNIEIFLMTSYQKRNESFFQQSDIKFIKQISVIIINKSLCFCKYMMNKFYKTTYPSRQPNNNNYLSSASGPRESSTQNKIKSSTITKKQVTDYNSTNFNRTEEKNLPRHIEKKIEIDPSLLFSAKKNSRNSTRPIDKGPKIIVNKTQSRFYEQNGVRERPKSKQQPRLKLNIDSQMKNQAHFLERPHTSKGTRPFKYVDDIKKRKMSFQNNQDLVLNYKDIDRRAMIASSHSRRPSKTSKYNFQTSIDPQFLNLFAAN